MRRTVAEPSEVFAVARTLGPDIVVVMPEGPVESVRQTIEQLRREVVTRDSVVVILSSEGEGFAETLQGGDANLVLPIGFSDADEDAPWHGRLETLLRLRERRENRVVAEFPVEVWLTDGRERRHIQAHALNLSSRGMLLEVSEELPSQSRIDVQFVAAAGLPEVSVVGEIVRCALTADKRCLAGVHFVVIRKDARIGIRDSLRALRPANAPADDGG
jgi:hypothetical protein